MILVQKFVSGFYNVWLRIMSIMSVQYVNKWMVSINVFKLRKALHFNCIYFFKRIKWLILVTCQTFKRITVYFLFPKNSHLYLPFFSLWYLYLPLLSVEFYPIVEEIIFLPKFETHLESFFVPFKDNPILNISLRYLGP